MTPETHNRLVDVILAKEALLCARENLNDAQQKLINHLRGAPYHKKMHALVEIDDESYVAHYDRHSGLEEYTKLDTKGD